MANRPITPGSEAQNEPERTESRRRVLDPVERAGEVLFGLIMVLTFTVSLNATEAGRSDVRVMLVGALGCNLAWGIIDAVMFLMGIKGERSLAAQTVRAIQEAPTVSAAHMLIPMHCRASCCQHSRRWISSASGFICCVSRTLSWLPDSTDRITSVQYSFSFWCSFARFPS